MRRPLWNHLATFLVWLLAAGSATYWALKFVQGPAAPASTAVAAPSSTALAVDTQTLAKGLGGGQAPIATDTANPAPAANALQSARFVLSGVVVNSGGQASGVALIAVDGKPPRPFRVGSQLSEGAVLHSVSAGRAMLSVAADRAPSLTLELPKQTSAVVGTALPARPALPAPTARPAPTANPSANSGNPMARSDSKAPRFGANRQREASQEARPAGQESPSPAVQQ